MRGQPTPNAYGWSTIDATPAHTYLWPAIFKLLRPLAKGDAPLRVLDLGCGNGYIASRIHALGFEPMHNETGFVDVAFSNADTIRWLWNSIVCGAPRKPEA